jgi:WD40 repeat protein
MSKVQGYNIRSKPGITSRNESTRFPVFGVCWSTSAIIYCGGGGSAKTGVGNAIVITPNASTRGKASSPTVVETQSEVCVSMDVYPKLLKIDTTGNCNVVYVAAAIGTQIRVYQSNTGHCMGIYSLLKQQQLEPNGESHQISHDTAQWNGIISVVVFAPNGYGLLVGCEDGTIVSLGLHYENIVTNDDCATNSPPKVVFTPVATLLGHTNAICGIIHLFYPDSMEVTNNCFTCAKDGTAKLWNYQTGELLASAQCSIVDNTTKTHSVSKGAGGGGGEANRRKLQPQPTSLVRGCAQGHYGQLYTVQSGRRGKAFVSQWKVLPKKMSMSATTPTNSTTEVDLIEIQRICVSDVPISAMCMSFDKASLILGSVDGSVLVLSLQNPNAIRLIRNYKEMHDLPITALAPCCRRYNPTYSVNTAIDVITASADGKLNFISFDKQPVPQFLLHLWFCIGVLVTLVGWIIWNNRCYRYLSTGITSTSDFTSSLQDFKLCILFSLVDVDRSPFDAVILH